MNNIDNEWWRGAVIYQIYPRSYQDSNGDGIGDLRGIAQRLPYIASLGVDAVWVSPFFTSPMRDFGYDVSDYRDVDPMFGSLDDFDDLVSTAHELGVKVIIDLVLSHTSDEHEWFMESRADRSNDKADWYVWADPKPDGTPPNNWLSIFGGSAWQWDARREQYYLHNFLVSQPDLNFHSIGVQEALLDVARFWLERGVDGFRLDTINFYTHDEELRDNPPLAPELRRATIAPSVNPYNHQEHIYDRNRPETLVFMQHFRKLLDSFGARTCVGEIGDAQRGLELLGEYTSGARAHMCYAFELLSGSRLDAERIKSVFDEFERVAKDGWACWAFSNHDVVRHTTRWELEPEAQRLFVTMMMCFRGSLCLYQGEELGLGEAELELEDLQDPYGIEFWPEFKGRDGCRTPMVWESQSYSAGFSSAKPWLPVAVEHQSLAVNLQEEDPQSLLHHYRASIAARNNNQALRSGDQSEMSAHENGVLSFWRTSEEQSLYCVFNLTDQQVEHTLPTEELRVVEEGLGSTAPIGQGNIELKPWGFSILAKPVELEGE